MVWHDLATIGTLFLIEGLLSADNALVLAVLVRHLPPAQRKRALKYGIWGAFFFRFIFLLLATWLMHAWYFKLLGAFYLLYVGIHHLIAHEDHANDKNPRPKAGFWKTVIMVELTDVAFSIDSILAAVAMSHKLWVVYIGGISGIIAMRFVAGSFLTLIDRFPVLAKGAYVLVIWIGFKLLLAGWTHTVQELGLVAPTTEMPEAMFWLGMALIVFFSLVLKPKSARRKIKDGASETK